MSGGNRNIGRAMALTLAKAGATALILYRDDAAAARKVCDEISQAGGRAGIYRADLTDIASLKPRVRQTLDEYSAEAF